ncbi:Pullulanase secretion envelope pulD [Plesiomonas shigelloides]|nr:Pullulanase secretion envelope pulD [Plesiomonas shigelloides]
MILYQTVFHPGEISIVLWPNSFVSPRAARTFWRRPAALMLCLALVGTAVNPQAVLAEEFSANFKDTDLKTFIETSGRNLNKTIIMGADVKGKVSIRTVTPLNERQYYQLFLNVLESQGYAVVTLDNGVLKVVKSNVAKTEPLPVLGEQGDDYQGDELITRVVPVRNVSVRELAPILRQMIDNAGSGNVVNYDPSNVIMLTGRAAVVERLTEVIQRVDRAGNKSEEVIPLEHASSSEIARVLENLTKNSKDSQPASMKSQVVADERTNSLVISGDPAIRDKMKRLIRQLDSEMERSGNSQVFYLKYSKAEDLVEVLNQVSGSLKAAQGEGQAGVRSRQDVVSIAASKTSNALIVTAPQDIMRSLESVITQLDVRRAQVHVEALIVEVAEGNNINFGVQWASKDAGLMQFSNGTQIPIGSLVGALSKAQPQKGSTIISENGATTINPDKEGDLSALTQLLAGYSGTAVGVVKGDWMALVQAVKADSSSNVLSTPSITTLDNQEAFFMVGQDVPVLTGSTTGSDNKNPYNTVERKKVGIMLKVTPQINEGNAVQLVIEQEVSKVEGQTNLDVVFGERKLKTTVLADDGELIVLGGLIDDQAGESVAKVPLLGDIPLLGHLFKSTANKKEKRNLMVFIRPTILRNGLAADGISQRKYNYIRAEQIYRDEQGLSLMPQTAQPILPTYGQQPVAVEVQAFLQLGKAPHG